jgi:hypothetical protein
VRLLVALVLATSSFAVGAQTYRCTGKDGKKHYGQTIPAQCTGVTVELLNSQGMVVRTINPQFEAEQRALEERNAADAKERAERDRRELERIESERMRPASTPGTSEHPAEPSAPGLSSSEPLKTPEIPERPDRERPQAPGTSPLRGGRR